MSNDKQAPRQPSKRPQGARYTVAVDGQVKSSFDMREAAEAEAARILAKFPILNVAVADSDNDSVKTLGPTKAKEIPEEMDEHIAS